MTRSRDLANLGDNTSKLEQQGLVKIIPSSVAVGSGSGSADANGNVSFSGVSNVALNGIFNSNYKNYLIMVSNIFVNNTTDRELQFRLRVNGTDNSTASSYISQAIYGYGTTVGTEYLAQDKFYLTSTNNVTGVDAEIILVNPFTTDKTNVFARTMGYFASLSGGSYVFYTKKGLHNQTVSYDGITLIVASGTMTGTVTVYGYN